MSEVIVWKLERTLSYTARGGDRVCRVYKGSFKAGKRRYHVAKEITCDQDTGEQTNQIYKVEGLPIRFRSEKALLHHLYH